MTQQLTDEELLGLPDEELNNEDPDGNVNQETESVRVEDKIEDDELKADIDSICKKVDNADLGLRQWRNRIFKKLSFYWDGYQVIYWDDQIENYAPVSEAGYLLNDNEDVDLEQYDKVINIFKPYGLTIISALTSASPKVKYIPSDADVIADIDTAKMYQIIQKKKIEKFNDPEDLVAKALKIKFIQGITYAYIYAKEDSKLGHYAEPVMGIRDIQVPISQCPACGATDSAVPDQVTGMNICSNCGYSGEFINSVENQQQEEIVDYNLHPKHKVCIDLYGPLNVEVSLFASDLSQVPILTLITEEQYGNIMDQFDLTEEPSRSEGDDEDQRWVRLPNRYIADDSQLVTVKQRWIRPWAFNMLEDKEKATRYKGLYPEGAYCVFIEDELVKIEGENLDDHWIAMDDPLEEFLQGIPGGQDLVDVQDMTNEGVNLILDTMEHNIPELFARPETLSLEQYKSQRARPGNITQAKPRAGLNLSGDFYESSQSSLSQEHTQILRQLMESGQFVSGAMPTLYGGAMKGAGETAKGYESMRAMSLQRHGPQWKVAKKFYANMMKLAVPMYAGLMREDENVVEEAGNGSYLNVMIEKEKLTGQVGEITFDSNEQIPISWAEERDVLIEMLPLATPGTLLGNIFTHPENTSIISEKLGISDIYIPGQEDREKQLAEITELLKNVPQPNPAFQEMEAQLQQGNEQLGQFINEGKVTPPSQLISSIPVDQNLDNHLIESETCASWLKSSVGRKMKLQRPDAYQNVYLHWSEHVQFLKMMQAQQMNPEEQSEENTEDNPQ